jgi:hypothetical protein
MIDMQSFPGGCAKILIMEGGEYKLMNIKKLVAGLVASAALVAVVSGPTLALSNTFASTTTLGNYFSYSSSNSGGLSVLAAGATHFTSTALPTFNDSGDTFSFSGLQNVGNATTGNNVVYDQNLSGGTFTLKQGATTLLTGVFTGADLDAIVGFGNKGANVNFQGVNYTGGTYWTAAQALTFVNPGDFSLELLSSTPISLINVPGGKRFHGFSGSGTGTFAANQLAPEPATVATFAFGVLGLAALIIRKRKTSHSGGLLS